MVTTDGEIVFAAAVMDPSRAAGWATGTALTPGAVDPVGDCRRARRNR
ncbi:MAG: hypothetical protein R2719_11065 [Micropruina sp.]